MTRIKILSAALVTALAFGCGEESPPGGPGAIPETTPPDATAPDQTADDTGMFPDLGRPFTRDDDVADRDRTFTITVPMLDVSVDPGATETTTINIDRGAEFRQTVTLRFQAPQGITVTPEEFQAAPDVDQVEITIVADATALAGEQTITVTATPETGAETSAHFNVNVGERN